MTDEELMGAPELAAIGKHIAAVQKLVEGLRQKSGRRLLGIFCESGAAHLIDGDLDSERTSTRCKTLDQGGCIVRTYPGDGVTWDGGWLVSAPMYRVSVDVCVCDSARHQHDRSADPTDDPLWDAEAIVREALEGGEIHSYEVRGVTRARTWPGKAPVGPSQVSEQPEGGATT